jgi:hypothetical protein
MEFWEKIGKKKYEKNDSKIINMRYGRGNSK